jgi:hypothetical protein
MSAGVAHAGHAICQEKWECEVGIPDVHVHVPETWNEIQSPAIHHLSCSWRVAALRRADLLDSLALKQNGLIHSRRGARGVDHGHM